MTVSPAFTMRFWKILLPKYREQFTIKPFDTTRLHRQAIHNDFKDVFTTTFYSIKYERAYIQVLFWGHKLHKDYTFCQKSTIMKHLYISNLLAFNKRVYFCCKQIMSAIELLQIPTKTSCLVGYFKYCKDEIRFLNNKMEEIYYLIKINDTLK